MAPKRPARPARSRATTPPRKLLSDPEITAPSTPGPIMDDTGDVIMGAEGVLVPPSPGFFSPPSDETVTPPASPSVPTRKSKMRDALNAHTGAGIKKSTVKIKSPMRKLVEAKGATVAVAPGEDAVQKPFPFMKLPGEIRNIVYRRCFEKPKQALLVHRPRMASLRPRTRLDRQRTLESDVKDRELGFQLAVNKSRHNNKKESKTATKRETNRPFWGLTQVCRQVRTEFRPIYMQKQEIGMDVTEIVMYLQTFYPEKSDEFAKLIKDGVRGPDLPFNGNLTIAVGDKPTDLERSMNGVEVIPLLDLWANSWKIEAGFGRYLKANYLPQTDGEAKDLYRLFGRRVLRNRQCSAMNGVWRSILRSRALASVTLHRKPAPRTVDLASLIPVPLVQPTVGNLGLLGPLTGPPTGRVTLETKPFIHVLFRPEFAEPWMTQLVSDIPKTPVDWLVARGFGDMENFDVKVGVAPAGLDRRS